MHQRQVIREAVKTALENATAAGTRVYETRVLPLRRLDLPAISVYTLEESVTPDSAQTAPRELTREMQLVIEGWVSAVGNVDDAMDAIALEIEQAMDADIYLGDTVGESILAESSLEVIETGDRLMGLATLTYQVIYRTMSPANPAEAELDDLITVESEFDLSGEQAEADRTSGIFPTEEP